MADLQTGTSRPLVEVNSDDVESYHSWSSNSRWFVFSSRRIDGLYTRPYIAYVDEDGKVGKPFLLPQKDAGFYQSFMKSFNIPEFITGKVKVRGRVLAIKAKEDKGTDVWLAQDVYKRQVPALNSTMNVLSASGTPLLTKLIFPNS